MAQMARALAQALAAGQGPLTVFCDTWEAVQGEIATGLRAWLADALFEPLRTLRPGARVVVAGRQSLDYPPLKEAADPRTLRHFSRGESDAYLCERGLDDPAGHAGVYEQARGHPLLTALWADLWAGRGGLDAADVRGMTGEWTARAATEWIVGRMVKRLGKTDPRTADALRYGVILRRFDLPALQALRPFDYAQGRLCSGQALLPDAGLDLPWYERFVGYAFLRQAADGYAFHELVRRVQLAWLQRQAPTDHEAYHRRALAHYEGRLEAGAGEDRRRAWEIEALYHRWAVAPDEALGDWQARVNEEFFHWRREPWLALLELAGVARRDFGLTRRAEGRLLHNWGAFHQRWAGWDEALEWYAKSVTLNEELGNKAGLATSYNNIGAIHDARGDYGAALEWYAKSVALKEELGDRAGLATSYNNIGLIHKARGDYGAALEWYARSVALTEELGDKAGLATSYNNIGAIHDARGDYEAALEWYDKSVALKEELGDKAGLATSYNNIGLIYDARGDYEAALEWYDKSVALKEELGDKAGLAVSYHNIGLIHKARGDYEAALEWYARSVALEEELGDKAGLAASYNNIGVVHRVRGDYGAALEWYARSVALEEELGDKAGLAASYNNIAFVHQAKGEMEQAVALFERSLAIFEELGARANAETVRRNLADARDRKR